MYINKQEVVYNDLLIQLYHVLQNVRNVLMACYVVTCWQNVFIAYTYVYLSEAVGRGVLNTLILIIVKTVYWIFIDIGNFNTTNTSALSC